MLRLWRFSDRDRARLRKRSECIIESAQRMTCVRGTQLSPSHVNFDPPSVTEADPLDVGAIVAAERAWVGL